MKVKILWTEWALPFGLSFGGSEYQWAFCVGPVYFVRLKDAD